MATYTIAVANPAASEIADYIKGTIAGLAARVELDGTIVEFDQVAYDTLTALPSDSDGHIDADGMFWLGGVDYPVGRL